MRAAHGAVLWLLFAALAWAQPLPTPTPTAIPSASSTAQDEHNHHEHEHDEHDEGHQHTTDCEHDHDVAPSAHNESLPALQGYMMLARNQERSGVGIPLIWARVRAMWLLVLFLAAIYWLRACRRATS